MIDKRDGVTKKPVKTQEYFPQSHPDRLPKGEAGKSGGKKGK
ncbi:hypothetical protein [Pseudomonas sp. P1.8]|jgi:hypothetical protein|nr:hypothetical protein [Pseudomonas sp. P1.8]